MTSFTIFGDSTTPQSLLGNEKGFIGQNGALATISFLDSIHLSSTSQLVILGSVTSLGGDCIGGTVNERFRRGASISG